MTWNTDKDGWRWRPLKRGEDPAPLFVDRTAGFVDGNRVYARNGEVAARVDRGETVIVRAGRAKRAP